MRQCNSSVHRSTTPGSQGNTGILAACLAVCLVMPGSAAAQPGRQATIPLPSKITTTDGKIYESVTFLRAKPDGLIIEYKPAGRGVGLAKLRFEKLPETIRQQFAYDAGKAAEFENDRAKALAQWRHKASDEKSAQATPPRDERTMETTSALRLPNASLPNADRYQVCATIAGAVILDRQTGQAWLVDLHSSLARPNMAAFMQPKNTGDN